MTDPHVRYVFLSRDQVSGAEKLCVQQRSCLFIKGKETETRLRAAQAYLYSKTNKNYHCNWWNLATPQLPS